MRNADGQQYPRDRVGEEKRGNSFDGVSPRRVGLGGASVTVVLDARLSSRGQKSPMRRRTVSDVGTSSRPMPSPGGRKLKKTRVGRGEGPPVSLSAAVAASENWSMTSSHYPIFHALQRCDTRHTQT